MRHPRSAVLPLLLAAVTLAVSACTAAPKSGAPAAASSSPAAAAAAFGEFSPTPAVIITETSDAGQGLSFRTPSGNIGCGASADSVRCSIINRSWTPPPAPADCDLDWGDGLSLDPKHGAGLACAGDSALDQHSKVIAYGHAIRIGTIVCTSTEANLRCESTATKHGFTLARENYTIF